MTNKELAVKLCGLASIYEWNDSIPQLYNVENNNLALFCVTPEAWHATVRSFGAGTKGANEDWLEFRPEQFPFMCIYGYKRQVCERVVVGTRIIPEEHVAAKEAEVIPAREEEIVEYRCRPFTQPIESSSQDVQTPEEFPS